MLFQAIAVSQAKVAQVRSGFQTCERAQSNDFHAQQSVIASLAAVAAQRGEWSSAVEILACVQDPSTRSSTLREFAQEAKRQNRDSVAEDWLAQAYQAASQVTGPAVGGRLRRQAIRLRFCWHGAERLGPWLGSIRQPATGVNNPIDRQFEERENAALLARIPGNESAARQAYARVLHEVESGRNSVWVSAGQSVIAHSQVSVGSLADAEQLASRITEPGRKRSVVGRSSPC